MVRKKTYSRIFNRLYSVACGQHPKERPWHFQWLSIAYLRQDLRLLAGNLGGRILDVGCGNKPYRTLFQNCREYIGIDIYDGPHVDRVITSGDPWPYQDASFDAILCTQVLEHTDNPHQVLTECKRVLKTQGTLLLSVPFIFPEHDAPNDFRRFSRHGIIKMFSADYDKIDYKLQGGIGSTIGMLLLNWMHRQHYIRSIRILFPLWALICLLVNISGWLLDRLDSTQAFYNNTLISARRK